MSAAVEKAIEAAKRLATAKYPTDPQMRLAYETGVLRGLLRDVANVMPHTVEKTLISAANFYDGQSDVLENT